MKEFELGPVKTQAMFVFLTAQIQALTQIVAQKLDRNGRVQFEAELVALISQRCESLLLEIEKEQPRASATISAEVDQMLHFLRGV